MKRIGARAYCFLGLRSLSGTQSRGRPAIPGGAHFFTVENVRWRGLPERFGHWNSVWKRFDRLSKAGVFEAFFARSRR